MNRRSFFNAITGASTSVAVIPSFEVPKLTANNINETGVVATPPSTAQSVFHAPREVVRLSANHVARELFKVHLKGYNIIQYPLPASPNDTLRLGNKDIILSKHMEATTAIPDINRALEQPDRLKWYLTAASNSLAYAIREHSKQGRYAVHMFKLPDIPIGLGVLSHITDNVRAVISYSSTGFAMNLTIDVLYGIES